MPQTPTGADEPRLVGTDRVLAVLADLATLPEGATLDEMVRRTGHPTATVHRALAALVRSGMASNDRRGHYVLGDEFVRLAFAFHEKRPEAARVRPLLRRLADRFGETVHYAVLDGREVVYREKVDAPTGTVRLTSTVGGRNPAHATGVGKLLLAFELPDAFAVDEWAGGSLEQRTERTATDAVALHRQLEETRRRGFAVDDQENEAGVNCIAFPIFLGSPTRPTGAVSVSALAYRTPLEALVDAAPEIGRIIVDEIGTIGATPSLHDPMTAPERTP